MNDATLGCGSQTLACTLGAQDFRQRLGSIRALAQRSLRSAERDDLRLRLTYARAAEAEVRALVGLERACCAFLAFSIEAAGDLVAVTIEAPAAARDSVEEIFAEFAAAQVRPAVATLAPTCPGC